MVGVLSEGERVLRIHSWDGIPMNGDRYANAFKEPCKPASRIRVCGGSASSLGFGMPTGGWGVSLCWLPVLAGIPVHGRKVRL